MSWTRPFIEGWEGEGVTAAVGGARGAAGRDAAAAGESREGEEAGGGLQETGESHREDGEITEREATLQSR